jgi:signal transduction histidine kinase
VVEAERLSRLVNQVLDMAKIESGHAEWHTTDVDLCTLLEQACRATGELFHERHAQLELKRPGEPLMLHTDPDRLTQVVINLLSNAAKFVPLQGGHVCLQLSRDDTGVTVQVEDNGPGVPAEQQGQIFEKFRQGGDALNRPQGTGLGLPISRQIIEHLGGHLWLASSSPAGATFAFFLPWQAPQTSGGSERGAEVTAGVQADTLLAAAK